MISSIIKKQFIDIKSPISIIWTKTDSSIFYEFINEACRPCDILNFDSTYYGNNEPSIVICNNRLTNLEKCISLSKFYHCPLLIIDHELKSNIVMNNFDTKFDISPVYQVAVSNSIYLSWNKIQNIVIPYNGNDDMLKNKWKNLIFSLIKENFKVLEPVL